MDGFYTNAGIWALGYYTAQELPFYYGLFDSSTLCVNFFCSVLGPTWPNRFYLAARTSGGITTNGVWGYGVFDYPIILDLLDAAGVTWGLQHRLGQRSVRQHRQRLRVLEEVRERPADARQQGQLPERPRARPAAAGLVHHPELRAGMGRAPAGRCLRRHGHPGGADHGAS
jgi:Phosphoesterase family